jgi:hypothetical protein
METLHDVTKGNTEMQRRQRLLDETVSLNVRMQSATGRLRDAPANHAAFTGSRSRASATRIEQAAGPRDGLPAGADTFGAGTSAPDGTTQIVRRDDELHRQNEASAAAAQALVSSGVALHVAMQASGLQRSGSDTHPPTRGVDPGDSVTHPADRALHSVDVPLVEDRASADSTVVGDLDERVDGFASSDECTEASCENASLRSEAASQPSQPAAESVGTLPGLPASTAGTGQPQPGDAPVPHHGMSPRRETRLSRLPDRVLPDEDNRFTFRLASFEGAPCVTVFVGKSSQQHVRISTGDKKLFEAMVENSAQLGGDVIVDDAPRLTQHAS